MPFRPKSLFIRGCVQGAIILISLSVCVTLVVFTGCESCARPISTNPGSMEAGECALTRVTCFAARRLELVAVAGRLWISWCVLGGAGFFSFFSFVFFIRTQTACCKYEAASCLIYLSTSTDQILYYSNIISLIACFSHRPLPP